MVLPTLKSCAYKNAKKSTKDTKHALNRLKLLLTRVLTRIEVITIFLGNDDIPDKELKIKISILSQLIGVKKQVISEIKELNEKTEKSLLCLGDIIS